MRWAANMPAVVSFYRSRANLTAPRDFRFSLRFYSKPCDRFYIYVSPPPWGLGVEVGGAWPSTPRHAVPACNAMPPPPGLHFATALRTDLVALIREATIPTYGRRAGALVRIADDGNHLSFETPDYRGRLSFIGGWPTPVLVHLKPLLQVARKLPRTEFVLLSFADGWLSVGPTRLSASIGT
jgi:hypothetical protein